MFPFSGRTITDKIKVHALHMRICVYYVISTSITVYLAFVCVCLYVILPSNKIHDINFVFSSSSFFFKRFIFLAKGIVSTTILFHYGVKQWKEKVIEINKNEAKRRQSKQNIGKLTHSICYCAIYYVLLVCMCIIFFILEWPFWQW